jgi:hypothetical protein
MKRIMLTTVAVTALFAAVPAYAGCTTLETIFKPYKDCPTKHDTKQDARLDGHGKKLTDHEGRITTNTAGVAANKAKNTEQDGRLDDVEDVNKAQDLVLVNHGSRISTNEGAIGNLQLDNEKQWNAIHANTDTLANHSAHLNKLDKGLAVAMSLPDAWLSDSKKFGIFGSIGGYNGETALGFAAIGRLDDTWTLNAKVGTDTSFDQVGWQVGAGAQW